MLNGISMSFQPDSQMPLYEQLYQRIVSELRSERIHEGERLPSKRMLSAQLGISRSTVETAYGMLLAEGYVRSVPRSGLYAEDVRLLAGVQHKAQPTPLPPSVPDSPSYEYVFSTGAVDTSAFPYSTWARYTKETLQQNPELLQRGDKQGDLPLRVTLLDFLRQYRGVRASSEQLIIGAGMEYLLELLMRILDEDAVYALEDPGYTGTYRTIENNHGQLVPVPLDGDGFNVEALEATGANVAYVTPSHQFPLGVTMPASRRARLLSWAYADEKRVIIEDDYDSEFRYTTRPIPAMQGLDDMGRVVYIGTFSRTIAPSMRIAYMILPPRLLKRYQQKFAHSSSTVSRFEQHTLCRFIENGAYGRHLRRVGNLYRGRCALLTERLMQIEGGTISGSGAGLHFLFTLPRVSEAELIRLAAEQGVKVHGLSEYARTPPSLNSTLVLGYAGLTAEQIEEAAARLRGAYQPQNP